MAANNVSKQPIPGVVYRHEAARDGKKSKWSKIENIIIEIPSVNVIIYPNIIYS